MIVIFNVKPNVAFDKYSEHIRERMSNNAIAKQLFICFSRLFCIDDEFYFFVYFKPVFVPVDVPKFLLRFVIKKALKKLNYNDTLIEMSYEEMFLKILNDEDDEPRTNLKLVC
jgi:hypothetical protein